MDSLRLIDNDNNVFNFPNDFWLDNFGWKVTNKMKNIAYYAGGKNTADKFLEARTILVKGFLRGDSLEELETTERGVQKAVLKGGKLYVVGDIENRYLEVSSPIVSSDYTHDYRYEKQFNVSYLVEYPFWQNAIETEYTALLDGSTGGDQFTVDNSDSDFLVYPVITIQANRGYNLPYIKLSNLSDSGMFFVYENPSFLAGSTLVIDCREGTVKLDGADSFEYFTTPRFLRVQALNNIFFYEGDPCTLTVTFRKIYL